MTLAKRRAAARAAARRVAGLAVFRRAKILGIFLSIPTEIETAPLIALARRANKTVAVPVVGAGAFASVGTFASVGRMRFAVLPKGRPSMEKNVYGILEPVQREWVDRLDLLIVPGAAFTPEGDRLGAGAGYYDRFLAGRPRPPSIGLCFDEQMAVRLPKATHDRRVDAVATPRSLYRGGHV